MSNVNFLKCKANGSILYAVCDRSTGDVCEDLLASMKPNTTDGAYEKHVPVVDINGKNVCVSVGSTLHPMLDTHYIEWIALKTDRSVYFRYLKPDTSPKACFELIEDEMPLAAYEFCNLHGLWMTDIDGTE